MKKLIIIGASNPVILRVIDDINNSGIEDITVEGFVDNAYAKMNKMPWGVKLIGPFSSISDYKVDEVFLINAIAGNMETRKKTTEYFSTIGYQFTNIVHPAVNVKFVRIGTGNIVYEHATIHPYVEIGNHNVISSNSGVAHESVLEDYIFVGPNSYICGKCHLGSGTYIGVGANILPRLRIGLGAVVGAGSLVNRDVGDFERVIGVPARVK